MTCPDIFRLREKKIHKYSTFPLRFTRQVHASAQHQFWEFWNQDVFFRQSEWASPARRQTNVDALLYPLSGSPSSFIHQSLFISSSLLTYLLTMASLTHSLIDCLQLQHLLCGIKLHQGSNLTHSESASPARQQTNVDALLYAPSGSPSSFIHQSLLISSSPLTYLLTTASLTHSLLSSTPASPS